MNLVPYSSDRVPQPVCTLPLPPPAIGVYLPLGAARKGVELYTLKPNSNDSDPNLPMDISCQDPFTLSGAENNKIVKQHIYFFLSQTGHMTP